MPQQKWFVPAGTYRDDGSGEPTVNAPVLTYEIATKGAPWAVVGGSFDAGWFKVRLSNAEDFTEGDLVELMNLGGRPDHIGIGTELAAGIWKDYSDKLMYNYLPIPTPTPTPSAATPTPTEA